MKVLKVEDPIIIYRDRNLEEATPQQGCDFLPLQMMSHDHTGSVLCLRFARRFAEHKFSRDGEFET